MRRRLWATLLALLTALFTLGPAATSAQPQPTQSQPESEQADFDYIAALEELTDAHARVLRLYWAVFDRTPDAGGAMFWIDQLEQCRSLRSIAAFFTASPEFVETYGDVDDSAFVTLVYANVLDRSPDATGERYWSEQLASGEVDRTQLLLDFSFSPEFVADHPLPSDGVPGRSCAASVAPSAAPQSYALQPWVPFAAVGPVTLTHPSAAVGLVGFHQSNHDGARQLTALDTSTTWFTMESRGRGTPDRSAADLAVHPLFEIRSPITGVVLRSGTYVLYCDYTDGFLVVEPDGRPGWEVKVLHLQNVAVSPGDRVEAGETIVATGATVFPFRSQIDDATAEPSWGHVHIEVVDPSIPDRPSGRSC